MLDSKWKDQVSGITQSQKVHKHQQQQRQHPQNMARPQQRDDQRLLKPELNTALDVNNKKLNLELLEEKEGPLNMNGNSLSNSNAGELSTAAIAFEGSTSPNSTSSVLYRPSMNDLNRGSTMARPNLTANTFTYTSEGLPASSPSTTSLSLGKGIQKQQQINSSMMPLSTSLPSKDHKPGARVRAYSSSFGYQQGGGHPPGSNVENAIRSSVLEQSSVNSLLPTRLANNAGDKTGIRAGLTEPQNSTSPMSPTTVPKILNSQKFNLTPLNTDPISSNGLFANARHTWRRPNKSRSAMSVKRSQSTPNVQQAVAAAAAAAAAVASVPQIPSHSPTLLPEDSLAMSAQYGANMSDKKRNKLGYHRTSVACGHCRRRKIRCLLAKDDPHGRCSNCIRLKKECNFYPVESSDRRPRSASKPEIPSHIIHDNPDTSSSTSSPSRSPQLSLDQFSRQSFSDISAPYSASLPLTPTYEYTSSGFDENYRNSSFSSTTGRLSIALSSTTSRRPSLAHMYTAPLPSKEFGSFSEYSPTFTEPSLRFAERFGERGSIGMGLDDNSTSMWRLTSSPSVTSAPFSPLPHHVNFGGMPPLNEHPFKPNNRVNSVDNGIDPTAQICGVGADDHGQTLKNEQDEELNFSSMGTDSSMGSYIMTEMNNGDSIKMDNSICGQHMWANSFDRTMQESPTVDTWFISEESLLARAPTATTTFLSSPLQSPVGVTQF